jgi:hypothetical protein
MKGGQIVPQQKNRFNTIKSNNSTNKNIDRQNIQVYVCSSSSIAVQLEMIMSNHRNIFGRRNSRNITPENNLIYIGVLKKLKQRGNRNQNQFDITTIIDGKEKYLFATNEENFYANLVPGNNILIIDVNPVSEITHEIEWAIRDLCRQLRFVNE